MGAEQAVSISLPSRVGLRWADMKPCEFCSSSDRGVHCWKVLLARKLVKKVGQEEEVKLVPKEVSKGEGTGELSELVEVGVDGAAAEAVAISVSARRCRSFVSICISPRTA